MAALRALLHIENGSLSPGVAASYGHDNVNSWSADIDGCMRHQNVVRRRDTTVVLEIVLRLSVLSECVL
jgi:hypothetical protein